MQTFQKILLLVLATGFSSYALAQNATDPPTGASNGTVPATQPNTSFAWFRGGNNVAGSGGSNNIFGTATGFNNPIYTVTNGVLRTKLNSTYNVVNQYPINGFNGLQGVNKSGNMLISTNNLSNIYTAKGAFSMLHLNGGNTTNTTFVQEGGWRTWMDVGVTFTSNQDLGYIGQRQIGTGPDKTEMVINWSDNAGNGNSGPDVCTFRFTASNGLANNDLNGDHPGGREIMRLLGDGNVGIGPRFSSTNNEPMSLLHLNSENNTDAWLQISNQGIQPATYSQFSGLRIGMLGQPIANRNGNAFIYNQENRHLIFSTNSPTPSNMNNTLERIRITSVNAPTDLPVAGYGIYNPGALGVNDTRVAISLFTGAPVTRPLSLLHLGLNAGTATPTLGTDGWRSWMENGMFVSSGSDHIFMGMKLRQGTALPMDSYDAVIGWGDNQPASAPAGSGPDNLRFIFTANPNSTGATAPATNANGVEAMRMTPLANTVYVGIGDDNNNAYSAAGQPGNTLEINSTANGAAIANTGGGTGFSGLRFTDLNSTSTTYTANPGTGVLSVNANGDVIYVPSGGSGNALTGAHNGTSISTITPNFVAFGQDVGQPLNPGQLLNNREIPQNQFNIQFIDGAVPTQGFNRISFGQIIPAPLSTKFYVFNNIERIGASFEMDATLVPQPAFTQLLEIATASRIIGLNNQIVTGVGVQGVSNNLISKANIGVSGIGINGNAQNVGVMGTVTLNSTSSSTALNYGGYFEAIGTGLQNVGIYANAGNAPNNFAAILNGDVIMNGNLSGTNNVVTSDQMFKTNVDTITNALSIIGQLVPKTYFMDTANVYGMKFSSKKQYGLIAQQVETVLPELVTETTKPAIFDSVAMVLNPAVTYKTLNYNAFIAILMKGEQEQQRNMDSLRNVITAMQAQMNNCCNAASRTQNPSTNQTDVVLDNSQNIVLLQNVPNPFAEQTTISYNLPESVQKAQLLFYDATGKLIKAVDLIDRGKGQVNVFANDLSNGIYSYALIADGQIADTKRMVKTN